MAIILRGKRKGQEVEIHQFANDWFSLEDGAIVSPLSLKLRADEIDRVLTSPHVGMLLYEFALDPFKGTFSRRRLDLVEGEEGS